ncbi:unnamed protein product, partial [Ectocarpus sp. 6 AP-2014]
GLWFSGTTLSTSLPGTVKRIPRITTTTGYPRHTLRCISNQTLVQCLDRLFATVHGSKMAIEFTGKHCLRSSSTSVMFATSLSLPVSLRRSTRMNLACDMILTETPKPPPQTAYAALAQPHR